MLNLTSNVNIWENLSPEVRKTEYDRMRVAGVTIPMELQMYFPEDLATAEVVIRRNSKLLEGNILLGEIASINCSVSDADGELDKEELVFLKGMRATLILPSADSFESIGGVLSEEGTTRIGSRVLGTLGATVKVTVALTQTATLNEYQARFPSGHDFERQPIFFVDAEETAETAEVTSYPKMSLGVSVPASQVISSSPFVANNARLGTTKKSRLARLQKAQTAAQTEAAVGLAAWRAGRELLNQTSQASEKAEVEGVTYE